MYISIYKCLPLNIQGKNSKGLDRKNNFSRTIRDSYRLFLRGDILFKE